MAYIGMHKKFKNHIFNKRIINGLIMHGEPYCIIIALLLIVPKCMHNIILLRVEEKYKINYYVKILKRHCRHMPIY